MLEMTSCGPPRIQLVVWSTSGEMFFDEVNFYPKDVYFFLKLFMKENVNSPFKITNLNV